MVDKMLLSYVNQMYILESELYSLCQIKSSLENERTVQMNRIQDEKFSYSLPRHSNTNIGEYVKGTLVLFLGILVVGGGYVQPEEMAKIVIYIIGGYILLSGIAILGGAVSEDLADSKRQQDMIEKEEARQKKILRENNKIRINCKKLTEGIQVIDAHIKEKNSILQKLYSYNIIHKNYRNFYGMSKIYQLLDTGICDSLTGVTGAYSQMRTDQIIDNQEVNNELQKKILVSNQMMCTAMSQTNRMLERISTQINTNNFDMQKMLGNIHSETEMTKFLAQSSKDNEDAIRASAEYIAYAEKEKRLADGHFY
ncbi:MAG: hypothetical protein KHX81_14750 [Clostridium sp.]|jgi:hypothetical protein|nr:hypothetical protein [Clostridium sp.]